LEAKDFLKSFVEITLQVKQGKDLKSNGENKGKEHLYALGQRQTKEIG
jgi:hypothetical protein